MGGFQRLTTTISKSTHTASYTLVGSDAGTVVQMNVAGTNTLTVPPNVFPVDTFLECYELGAGQTTITAGSGVTFESDGSKAKLAAQFATVGLRQRDVNVWVLSGDLSL